MTKPKAFDCIEMKDAIQAELRKEHEGLTDEEIECRRKEWLATSDSDIAKWWRSRRTSKPKE